MSNLTLTDDRLMKKIKLNSEFGMFYTPYVPTIFLSNTRVVTKKKYTFSRAKWYVAEFSGNDYDEVDEWCTTRFGKHDQRPDAWSRWWHRYEYSIHFRDEKDYIMFVLRWAT